MSRITLGEIAERIGGDVAERDSALPIAGVKPLEEACDGYLSIVTRRADVRRLEQVPGAAAVVDCAITRIRNPAVRVSDPKLALAQLLRLFHARPREVIGIDARAIIDPNARIGRDVNIAAGAHIARGVEIGDRVDIYPGVYLGEGVRVGDESVIYANVSVYADTVIGRRARIHSGAVIGSDGFGYTPGRAGELCKIPQVGSVVIGDDVEIGANTTVDRATMSETRIGSGTKIDNLVQIGHNVEIGNHVCIVGQSGIAGSVTIHDRAVLGAAAGLLDHVTIGEEARIAARAGVIDDVPPRTSVAGTPAIALAEALRAYSLIAQLPDYRRRLKALERRCRRLEVQLDKHNKDGAG